MTNVVIHQAKPKPTLYIDPNSDLIRKKEPIFAPKPTAKDFPAAENYLNLIFPADVVAALLAKLKTTKVTQIRANDILRAAKTPPIDDKDPGVQKAISDIKDEAVLAPVLLIQGDLFRGIHLIIADGMHRCSAAFLRNPDAMVSAVMAVVDWSALESPRANG